MNKVKNKKLGDLEGLIAPHRNLANPFLKYTASPKGVKALIETFFWAKERSGHAELKEGIIIGYRGLIDTSSPVNARRHVKTGYVSFLPATPLIVEDREYSGLSISYTEVLDHIEEPYKPARIVDIEIILTLVSEKQQTLVVDIKSNDSLRSEKWKTFSFFYNVAKRLISEGKTVAEINQEIENPKIEGPVTVLARSISLRIRSLLVRLRSRK